MLPPTQDGPKTSLLTTFPQVALGFGQVLPSATGQTHSKCRYPILSNQKKKRLHVMIDIVCDRWICSSADAASQEDLRCEHNNEVCRSAQPHHSFTVMIETHFMRTRTA